MDGGVNNLPGRGVPRFRAPTIREDGIKQGAANRPDTSGDVACAEDGGGHGHPKGGGMAKRMENEPNLITRRGWRGVHVRVFQKRGRRKSDGHVYPDACRAGSNFDQSSNPKLDQTRIPY